MTWTVQLDPPGIATGRTMLDLNSGAIAVDQAGISFGDAAIQPFLADARYGSSSVDFRIPNRVVTIPLFLGTGDYANVAAQIAAEEAARAQLQQKISLLQREGGWFLRQRSGGPAMYADIVDATLALPDAWGETGGIEDKVVVTLTLLPDFYGDEVTLDTLTATGNLVSKLKASGADAVISGDYPARCRIIVNDTSGNDQHGVLLGLRSRHYDSAATAALVYEAEALTPVNGAATAAVTGTSSGSVVRLASPMPTGVWVSMLSTNLVSAGQPLTHVGSYRVWARAAVALSTSGTFQLQLLWGVGSLSVPVTNTPAQVPSDGGYYLVDLGSIHVDPLAVGTTEWFGAVQAWSSNSAVINVDSLYLQPLDEGAAQLAYTPVAPASTIISPARSPSAAANDAAVGTVAWSNPTNVFVLDGAKASVTLTGVQQSEWLKATGCGFAVPSGATIKGIAVQVYDSATLTGSVTVATTARLVKAGTVQSTAFSSSMGGNPDTYGSSVDLWGGTWTPADVNNTGFGAAWSVNETSGGSGTYTVDNIAITVYYTLASGFTVAQDAVIYAGKTAELRTEGMLRTADGTVYGAVSSVIGDLPRLPPSGLENRPVELFVKPSRGTPAGTLADAGLDGLSVQVKYRPAWLSRP